MPLMVLAAMVTVIASQALISGAYSLTCQATRLGSCPGLRSITSPRHFGQFYVSSINSMATWKRGRELLAARMRTNRVRSRRSSSRLQRVNPSRCQASVSNCRLILSPFRAARSRIFDITKSSMKQWCWYRWTSTSEPACRGSASRRGILGQGSSGSWCTMASWGAGCADRVSEHCVCGLHF
ncbi:KUP/HAK/KT family potassium transporter [Acidimicrobiales bacterium]|nr:KUP/HAK/KT family potassium transporter [Acidimicrobiales bacterium]